MLPVVFSINLNKTPLGVFTLKINVRISLGASSFLLLVFIYWAKTDKYTLHLNLIGTIAV